MAYNSAAILLSIEFPPRRSLYRSRWTRRIESSDLSNERERGERESRNTDARVETSSRRSRSSPPHFSLRVPQQSVGENISTVPPEKRHFNSRTFRPEAAPRKVAVYYFYFSLFLFTFLGKSRCYLIFAIYFSVHRTVYNTFLY